MSLPVFLSEEMTSNINLRSFQFRDSTNNNKSGTETADTRDNNLISFIKRAFLSSLVVVAVVIVLL